MVAGGLCSAYWTAIPHEWLVCLAHTGIGQINTVCFSKEWPTKNSLPCSPNPLSVLRLQLVIDPLKLLLLASRVAKADGTAQ